MQDFKKDAAVAAVKLIRENSVIGFGAGSTIAHLIGGIKQDPILATTLVAVTSSFLTRQLLEASGVTVKEMGATQEIDIYFDGCDQFDRQLNALKSGGGIHTREKILATMAREFILVGDEAKSVEKLDGKYPLVVEVIPDALAYVRRRIQDVLFPRECVIRLSSQKDGAVITENGNYLLDVWFNEFPEPAFVDEKMTRLPGVLGHSLFFQLARRAIVAGAGGITIK